MQTGPAYHVICDSHSERGSILLAVSDDAGRAVGAACLVVSETWQLTRFDIQSRDARVAASLCHVIVQTLRLNRVRNIAMTLDKPAREFLAAIGLFPTTSSVAELLDQQRRFNPEGFRLVSQGQGLGDVELPYPGELLTASPAAPALAG